MKKLLICLLALFLSVNFTVWAKKSLNDSSIVQAKSIAKDTVYIVKQTSDYEITKSYQDILEKTNQQLSLWTNPYGVMVGVLGVLFTIVTIIAAIVIYRQSKEYKELIKDSLKNHETLLQQLIQQKVEQLKVIETGIDLTIKEYEQKFKTATEENKKELRTFLTKLEEQKASVDKQIFSSYLAPKRYNLEEISRKYAGEYAVMCPKCNYIFNYDEKSLNSQIFSSLTCPKCNNVIMLSFINKKEKH